MVLLNITFGELGWKEVAVNEERSLLFVDWLFEFKNVVDLELKEVPWKSEGDLIVLLSCFNINLT